jgi:hypothetical protein
MVAGAAAAAVAVVAAATFGSGGPGSPAPLFVAAAGAGSPAAATAGDEARIGMWVDYDYVAGPGLPSSSGEGVVYRLQLAGSPEEVLARVAAVFSIDGAPRPSEYSDPAWPTFVVGPEDGSGPAATVTWTGTGSWWFSNPSAYPQVECSTSADGAERCTPPVDGPSAAPGVEAATSAAVDLFAELGFDVAPGDVRVSVDEWQTSATANLTVDGVRTAVEFGVSWAPSGDIAWAYGHAVDVVAVGSQATVSPVDAVARADDWRWFGAAGPDYQGGMAILPAATRAAEGDAAAVEGVGAGEVAVEPAPEPTVDAGGSEPAPVEPEPAPTDSSMPEPLPEPISEPEVVVVELVEAEATLLLMWDVDGGAWLVPGYALRPSGEDWWVTVVSLPEGVITLPEPVGTEARAEEG